MEVSEDIINNRMICLESEIAVCTCTCARSGCSGSLFPAPASHGAPAPVLSALRYCHLRFPCCPRSAPGPSAGAL